MKALIPYIHSKHADIELLFALRCLDRHVKDVDGVVIVGDRPDFLNDSVQVLDFKQEGVKDYAIAKKVEYAFNESDSSKFFFMNDDHFFTKDCESESYPYYHRGDLYKDNEREGYNRYQNMTKFYLNSIGYDSTDFDVHCPIVYEREKFLELSEHWQKEKSFLVKSMYCNIHGIKGKEYKDCKLRQLKGERDFEKAFRNECFSIYDYALKGGAIKWLASNYPNRSRYENDCDFRFVTEKPYREKRTGFFMDKWAESIVGNERAMELLSTGLEYVRLDGYVNDTDLKNLKS